MCSFLSFCTTDVIVEHHVLPTFVLVAELLLQKERISNYYLVQELSPGQYKRRCNILSLFSSLTLLHDSSSLRTSQHEISIFSFWASVPLGIHSSIYSFLPRPSGPRNFKVRCLIPALSFATVFFHVRTHSTKSIFLAVIKLLETHQYSRPHFCISFLNITGQTTICPFVKDLRTDSIWVRDSDLLVTQANEQKMELNGMVHLVIKIGGIKTWSKLYSAPDLDRTMILGEDW